MAEEFSTYLTDWRISRLFKCFSRYASAPYTKATPLQSIPYCSSSSSPAPTIEHLTSSEAGQTSKSPTENENSNYGREKSVQFGYLPSVNLQESITANRSSSATPAMPVNTASENLISGRTTPVQFGSLPSVGQKSESLQLFTVLRF